MEERILCPTKGIEYIGHGYKHGYKSGVASVPGPDQASGGLDH